MSEAVAVNGISYSQRPPHSPAISPARGHSQPSNNEVSSEISFVITQFMYCTFLNLCRFNRTVRLYIRFISVPPLNFRILVDNYATSKGKDSFTDILRIH